MKHIPVLKNEIINIFAGCELNNYVDGTLGLGGHILALNPLFKQNINIFAFDKDIDNIKVAKKNLVELKNVEFINAGFEDMQSELNKRNIHSIDGVLLDLGLSSPHIDNPERGFSFRYDAPLDMRFDLSQEMKAFDVINFYRRDELEILFREYAEERAFRKIARIIIEERKKQKIYTTFDLVKVLEKVFSHARGKMHFATKVFQALRIEVNDELGVLEEVLPQITSLLSSNGKVAIISYHSLEDRIVKHYFKSQKGELLNIITKKPIVPTVDEIEMNPRARSAKLRVAEKI